MSPVLRGLRQEALHGAVEESLIVDEVHAFEARESKSLWVMVVDGTWMEGKKLFFLPFFVVVACCCCMLLLASDISEDWMLGFGQERNCQSFCEVSLLKDA